MRQVIFLPSHICTFRDPGDGSLPKHQDYPDDDGNPRFRYWSTGRLERALKEGCQVHVLLDEALRGLAQHAWWLKLLSPGQLIVVGSLESAESLSAIDALLALYERQCVGTVGLGTANTWQYVIGRLCSDFGFTYGTAF